MRRDADVAALSRALSKVIQTQGSALRDPDITAAIAIGHLWGAGWQLTRRPKPKKETPE